MAVNKINGFAAPYRSRTFQAQADAQVARSGILTMDGVVTQPSSINIPAFSFIQNGLIVSKDTDTDVSVPTMDAPYYLVVSAVTPSQLDDLIFSFAKTPLDLSANEVIVAAYDGLEWRMPRFLSIDGIYNEMDRENIEYAVVGPYSGLLTTVDGPNYSNSPGVLVDQQGLRQVLETIALFPIIATDPDYSRVDRVIYRRPDDSVNRIGTRRFTLGGTYAASPATAHAGTAFIAGSVRQTSKVVIGSDNAAHMFNATGYGDTFSINYSKLASDRTTLLVAATTLQAATEKDFSVAIDASDNLHLVFVQNSQIFYRKFDSVGTALTAAIRIDSQATPSSMPAVAIDPSNTKVFVVYQSLLGALNNQIFFTTRDLSGNLVTAPANLIANASDLNNPDIFVTDDLWVYVAWEDLNTGRIYYKAVDDIGAALPSFPAAVLVSDDTTHIGFGTLVDGATRAKIWVTDNKSVFITFLQDKGGSVDGLAIWNDGAAFMQTLLTVGEHFTTYDVTVDSFMNGVHLLLARAASVDYVKLEGEGGGGAVVFTLNIDGAGAESVATARDALGSMFHLWSTALAGTFSTYEATVALNAIGPAVVAGGTPISLSSSQLLVPAASFSGQTPVAGDQVVVAGSGAGNDGTKTITASELMTLNVANDSYRITVSAPFAAAENPAIGVTADFDEPDGNLVSRIKSTSELISLAYRFDTLDTDILLARIGMPGSVILNYLPPGAFSGMDRYMPYGTAVVDWEETTAGELTFASGFSIQDLVNNYTFSIAAGAFPMAEDDAIYVELSVADLTPTPIVTPISNLPFSLPIQVLGAIKGGQFIPHLLGRAGIGELDSGESDTFGEDLPAVQRARLGILTETTFQPYTSITNVALNDTHPEAISKLDAAMGAIQANNPIKEAFISLALQDTFVASGMSWDANNAVLDLEFYIDGRWQEPGVAWTKLSTTSIQTAAPLPAGKKCLLWKQGTSSGGGGGGTDLQNITVNPAPNPAGGFALGTLTRPWKSLFLKDKVTSQVYELEIVSGVVQFTLVP